MGQKVNSVCPTYLPELESVRNYSPIPICSPNHPLFWSLCPPVLLTYDKGEGSQIRTASPSFFPFCSSPFFFSLSPLLPLSSLCFSFCFLFFLLHATTKSWMPVKLARTVLGKGTADKGPCSLRKLIQSSSIERELKGSDVILLAERDIFWHGMWNFCYPFFSSYIYSLLKHKDPFVILKSPHALTQWVIGIRGLLIEKMCNVEKLLWIHLCSQMHMPFKSYQLDHLYV